MSQLNTKKLIKEHLNTSNSHAMAKMSKPALTISLIATNALSINVNLCNFVYSWLQFENFWHCEAFEAFSVFIRWRI